MSGRVVSTLFFMTTGTAQAPARGRAEALLNRDTSNNTSFACAVTVVRLVTPESEPESPKRQRMMCVIMHVRPLTLGTYT